MRSKGWWIFYAFTLATLAAVLAECCFTTSSLYQQRDFSACERNRASAPGKCKRLK